MNIAYNFNDTAVVVPVYNNSIYLVELFKSLDAVIDKIEIYFIDDCSPDGSIEQIKRHYGPRVVIISNGQNKGASYSRNRALKQINKKYLIFIDPDIIIDPADLFKLLTYRRDFDVVFPQVVFFNGQLLSPMNDFEKQRCNNSAIFIINRETIDKKQQFFDEDMKIYVEDNDFFSRLWTFKFKFKFCDDIVVRHPEKRKYSEEYYYQKVKNSLLFFLKNRGIIKFRFNSFFWISANLCLFFLAALLNRNFTVASGGFENVKFTDQSRFKLIRLFFKAIFWNVVNINSTLKKRKLIKEQIRVLSG